MYIQTDSGRSEHLTMALAYCLFSTKGHRSSDMWDTLFIWLLAKVTLSISVRDLLSGGPYAILHLSTLFNHSLLVYLLYNYFKTFNKQLAIGTILQRLYCNIVILPKRHFNII